MTVKSPFYRRYGPIDVPWMEMYNKYSKIEIGTVAEERYCPQLLTIMEMFLTDR